MSSMTPTAPGSAAGRPGPARPASRSRAGTPAISGPTIDPFRVLRRHWLAIAASAVIGCALGVIVWFALDRWYPLYTAAALFEIAPGIEDPGKVGVRDIAQEDTVIRIAGTETRIMLGRLVLGEAMKNPEIKRTEWHKQFIVKDEDTGREVFSIDEAVDELEEEMGASLVRNTNLFSLNYATHWEKDVPVIVNAVKSAYMTARKKQEDAVFNDNARLFDEELKKTNREIDDLREEIAIFIREKGITALDDPRFNQSSLKMADLVSRMAVAQEQLSMVRSTYEQTAQRLEGRIAPSDEDRFIAENDPIIQRKNLEMLEIKTQLERLKEKYKQANDPTILEVERTMRATENQREAEINNIIKRNLSAQLGDLANNRITIDRLLKEMSVEYEATDRVLRDLAADMSRYMDMEKRRDLLELQRDDQSKLINELRLMRTRADAARVRVAQDAYTPREKSFPLPEYMVPLVAVLTVLLTTGGIFLRELSDTRVKTPADLAVIPGARVLGVIPDAAEDPAGPRGSAAVGGAELVVTRYPSSVMAESYRQTISPIAKLMTLSDHQSLLLVGGMPGAGTTTVATNLAATAAAAGKRVIIVDANFRRPRMSEALGQAGAGHLSDLQRAGLGDLLAGEAQIDQVIVKGAEGIDMIGPGTPASRVFERLHNGRFASVLAELRNKYDLILIDTPPAVVAGDALAMASRVDAAIIVVRANQEERGLVARVINQLNDAQCELLGLVLNRARGTVGGYFKKNFAAMADYAATATKSS